MESLVPDHYGVVLLKVLIFSAVIFTCLFLAGLGGLLLRRLWECYQEKKWSVVEKSAKANLLGWLQNADGDALPDVAAFSRLPVLIQLQVFEGLLQMVRGSAMEKLALVAEASGLRRHLIKMLNSRRKESRIEAARLLAVFADRPTGDVLVDKLKRDSVAVAVACAESLLKTADQNLATLVGNILVGRKIHAYGLANRAFTLMAESFPQSLVKSAFASPDHTIRIEILRFAVERLGPAILFHIRHDPEIYRIHNLNELKSVLKGQDKLMVPLDKAIASLSKEEETVPVEDAYA